MRGTIYQAFSKYRLKFGFRQLLAVKFAYSSQIEATEFVILIYHARPNIIQSPSFKLFNTLIFAFKKCS